MLAQSQMHTHVHTCAHLCAHTLLTHTKSSVNGGCMTKEGFMPPLPFPCAGVRAPGLR